MRVVTWAEGRHHALVYPSGALLLDGSIPSAAAEHAWKGLRSGAHPPSPAGVTEALAHNDKEPCGFALAHADDHGVRISARGGFSVRAETTEGPVHLATENLAAPVERVLVNVISLQLTGEGPSGSVSRRIEDGIVPASRVSMILLRAPLSSRPAEADPSTLTEPTTVLDGIGSGLPTTDTQEVPTFPPGPRAEATPHPPSAPSEPAVPGGQDDHLEEQTRNRPGRFSHLWSAPPRSATASGADPRERPGQPANAPSVPPDSEEPPPPRHPADPPALVPGASSSSPPPGAAASIAPVIVAARVCPTGHANPPTRSRCRVCDAPLSGPLHEVPRPPLGRLWISTGESVEVVRSLLVGRRPSDPSALDRDAPALLPLPFKHVSSNHLRIRVDNWLVLAEDLGATNGTFVHRIGSPPVRLTARPWSLVSGDCLDLGLGVHLTFEDLP